MWGEVPKVPKASIVRIPVIPVNIFLLCRNQITTSGSIYWCWCVRSCGSTRFGEKPPPVHEQQDPRPSTFRFLHLFFCHGILWPFSFWVSWVSWFPPSPTAQGLLEFAIFVFSQQFSAASPMALGFCVFFWWLFSDASSGITWHSVAIEMRHATWTH